MTQNTRKQPGKKDSLKKAFLELELTAEQRNVCNRLLECRGRTYIAGMNDAFRKLNNKIFIADKEKFAEKMIERTIDNDFRDVMFSYDVAGYPNRIEISVYTNELSRKLSEKNFTVLFESDTDSSYNYNVKDNPEHIRLRIEYE